MKKNECNIVRDLMPLVLDRAASDESREAVEDHIAACGECRKQYDAMRADLPEDIRAEYEEDRKQFADALKTVRRKKQKRRIRMTVLAAAVCVVAVLAGLFAYDALFWKMSVPVDNSLYSLSVCETQDGRYIVTVDASKINFHTEVKSRDKYADETDITYIYFTAAPIHAAGDYNTYQAKWDIMIFENDGESKISEIRQGTPDSYLTIWKQGEPIPAASKEMERYYALDKAYWQWLDALPETEDGKMIISDTDFSTWGNRLEEARKAVPEWK